LVRDPERDTSLDSAQLGTRQSGGFGDRELTEPSAQSSLAQFVPQRDQATGRKSPASIDPPFA
jgi:hypothetical protein